MLWVVRGTDVDDQDISVVIEAASRAEAEYIALRRGVPVVVIEEANAGDIDDARSRQRLWQYTIKPRHTCLGRPVGRFQLACLAICGILTGALLFEASKNNFKQTPRIAIKIPFLQQ